MNTYLSLLSLLLLSVSALATPSITEYQLLEKQRIGLTEYRYTYQAVLHNDSPQAIQSATATLSIDASNINLTHNQLTFGAIAAGASASSQDQIAFTYDRAEPVGIDKFAWDIQAQFIENTPTPEPPDTEDNNSGGDNNTAIPNIHFLVPKLQLQTADGNLSYWAHFQYAPQDNRLIFAVTDYGAYVEDSNSAELQAALLNQDLQLAIPRVQVQIDDSDLPVWADLQFIPSEDGKLLFEVTQFGGFKTINGQVNDPIVNALIELFNAQGESVARRSAATDAEGKFSVEIADKYTVAYAKVRQGQLRDGDFLGELFSYCTELECTITPFSHLQTRVGSLYAENKQVQSSALLQQVLNLTNDPFMQVPDNAVVDMASWRERISNGGGLSTQLIKLSNDITDGYLDDTDFAAIFKQARLRVKTNQVYAVNHTDLPPEEIIDDQGVVTEIPRNLVLENTAGDAGTNDQIGTSYVSDVYLIELDENGEESVVYQSFNIGQWREQLNKQTTILAKVFSGDFGLMGLPETEKDRIAQLLLSKHASLLERAEDAWLESVNINVLMELLADGLVDDLITYARSYATQEQFEFDNNTLVSIAPDVSSRRATAARYGTSSMDLGWVKVSYAENNFKFQNFLPLYMSVTNGGYSFSDNNYNWTDALFSPNLMDPAVGGAVGLASRWLPNWADLTSATTPMSGTTFDTGLFPSDDTLIDNFPDENAYCTAGEGRYVASKKLAWSIHTVNNAILTLQAAAGTAALSSVKFNKITKLSSDKTKLLEKAGKVLTTINSFVDATLLAESVLGDILDQVTDNPNVHDFRTNAIEPLRNAVGNIQSIIDTLSKITTLPQATNPDSAFELLVGKKPVHQKADVYTILKESPRVVEVFIAAQIVSTLIPKNCKLESYDCKDFAYLLVAVATKTLTPTNNHTAYQAYKDNIAQFTAEILKATDTSSSDSNYRRFVNTLNTRLKGIVTDLDFMNNILTAGITAADDFESILRSAADIALTQTKAIAKSQARTLIKNILRIAMGANAFGLAEKANELVGLFTAQFVMPDEYPFDIKVKDGQVSFEGPALQYSGLDYNIDHILNYKDMKLAENKSEFSIIEGASYNLGEDVKTFPCSGYSYSNRLCIQTFFILENNIKPNVENKSVLLVANQDHNLRTRNEARFYFSQSQASVESVMNNSNKASTMLRWTFNIQKLNADGDTRNEEDWTDFNPEQNKVPNSSNNGEITIGEIKSALKEENGAGYFEFFDVLAAQQGGWWTSAEASVLVNHKSRGIYRDLFGFQFVDTSLFTNACPEQPVVDYPEQSITFYKMASAVDLMRGYDSLAAYQNGSSPGIHFQAVAHNGQDYLCITNYTEDNIPLKVLAFTAAGDGIQFDKTNLKNLPVEKQVCYDKAKYQDYTFAVYDAIFSQYAKDYDIGSDTAAFQKFFSAPAHAINSDPLANPDEYNAAFIVKRTADEFYDVGPGLITLPEIVEIVDVTDEAKNFPKTFTVEANNADGTPLSMSSFRIKTTTEPEYGVLSKSIVQNKWQLTYTLNDNSYLGADKFSFVIVTNTGLRSYPETVNITVVASQEDNTTTQPGTKEISIQHVNTGFTHYFGVEDADMSKDGCWVAFTTQDKYSGVDENDSVDAYVRDMCTAGNKPELVSVGVDANSAPVASGMLELVGQKDISISADGRYIAFASTNVSLLTGGTYTGGVGIGAQIFVRDREAEKTYLISTDMAGNLAQWTQEEPSISSDGRTIVFKSGADNLDPDYPTSADAFYAYEFTDNTYTDKTITLVSIGLTDAVKWVTSSSDYAHLSGSGEYVIFRSDSEYAMNLTENPSSTSYQQLFLRDLQGNTLELVSVAADGLPANNTIYDSAISADGNYIAFVTNASNLVNPSVTNGKQHIYVRDRNAGKTYLVTTDNSGNPADNNSGNSTFNLAELSMASVDSPSTLMLAFTSEASNLSTGGATIPLTTANVFNTYGQIIHSLDTTGISSINVLISQTTDAQGNTVSATGGTRNPVIADNGTAVMFVSGDSVFYPAGSTDIQGAQVYWWGEKAEPATTARSGKLNDTGITWGGEYPDGNNTTCAGELISQQDCSHGRDATHNNDSDGHAGFSFRKIDGGNCVQDNVTGLMWEVKQGGNGTVGDEGLHDADDGYNWYDTNPDTNGGADGYADNDGAICHGYQAGNPSTYCNTQAYVARVNAAGWCGFKDWRMPEREDLRSIVDYSRINPAIDTNYFPNTQSSWYWSGSPDACNSDYAWGVSFHNGGDHNDSRNGNARVRLVRGGQ